MVASPRAGRDSRPSTGGRSRKTGGLRRPPQRVTIRTRALQPGSSAPEERQVTTAAVPVRPAAASSGVRAGGRRGAVGVVLIAAVAALALVLPHAVPAAHAVIGLVIPLGAAAVLVVRAGR